MKLLIALISFATVCSASAMELSIVPNTKKLGDKKAYIVAFDGEFEVDANLLGKILVCYENFGKIDKAAFLDLMDNENGIKDLEDFHVELIKDHEMSGYLTLSNRELNETFVKTKLKECLSK